MVALAAEDHRNPGREAGRRGVMERGNDERPAHPVILQQTFRVILGIPHIHGRKGMIMHDLSVKDEFCVAGEFLRNYVSASTGKVPSPEPKITNTLRLAGCRCRSWKVIVRHPDVYASMP